MTKDEPVTDEARSILEQYARSRVVGERYGAVQAMTFGKGRLNIGRLAFIDFGADVCYCYDSVAAASVALAAWDGNSEPAGWYRCPTDGRRRPDGDVALEYVRE